jgi:predicted permease
MKALRRFLVRLTASITRRRDEKRLRDEIEEHLAHLTAEKIKGGMSPDEARRQAVLKFGAVEAMKEDYRDQLSLSSLENLAQDIRYAIRGFRRSPGFAAVVVVTLAFGIGASTAIFSVVHAVLLRSLPYHNADRLVRVWETDPPERARRSDRRPVSPASFQDWRREHAVFADIAATTSGSNQSLTLTNAGTPLKITRDRVTGSFLRVLGVQPILGRGFLPQEEQPGQDQVVLLSYDLWEIRFGRDNDLVGRSITLDGNSYTVIGVLPQGFRSPDRLNSPNTSFLLTPLTSDTLTADARGSHILYVIARLQPGTTLQRAQSRVAELARTVERLDPEMKGWSGRVVPLSDDIVANIQPTLLALVGAVGCLMLIACANVANLLLARVSRQSAELAIRAALGAGRVRLARQLLAQSLILATCGGAVGVLMAVWLMDVLVALAPTDIPRLGEAGMNGSVMAFAIGVSVLTSLLFGMLPALQAAKRNVNASLQQVGRTVTDAFASTRLRNALVIAEVAITIALVIEAGLLVNTFRRVQAVDLGINADNVIAMEIAPPLTKYPQPSARIAFFQHVLERVEALPGVRSAAVVSHMPFGGSSGGGFLIEDRLASDPREWDAEFRAVSRDYFRTMGIPILAGRSLTAQDTANGPLVAVINKAMAQRFWPNDSPLGKRIRRRSGPVELPWLTIVGIAGDVRHLGPTRDVFFEVYIPYTQPSWASSGAPFPFPRELVVRTQTDPGQMASLLQQQVWSIDKDQPVTAVRTLDSLAQASVSRQRFTMLLFGAFGFIALVLAMIGIHSVLSYTVTQRTHEIGIRAAMGAKPGHLIARVMGQGLTPVAAGVVIGIGAAVMLTRFTSTLLFGVTPTDPTTFLSVSALFVLMASFTCYYSASKAARVDPLVALRYE